MTKHLSDRELVLLRNKMGENLPVPPKPKKRNYDESIFQQSAVKWWTFACRQFGLPEIALMAHPNQALRSPQNGARMKAEGMRKGVPDMQMTVARGKFHGLWMENKTDSGALSKEQKEHRDHLINQGYHFAVCRSSDDIIREISTYLLL